MDSDTEASLALTLSAASEAESASDYRTALELYQSAFSRLRRLRPASVPFPHSSESLQSRISALQSELQDAVSILALDEANPFLASAQCSTKFVDVEGLEPAKEVLTEFLIIKARFPELFQARRAWGRGFVLIHGPAGCGKTYLVRACAGESQTPLVHVSLESILHSVTSPALLIQSLLAIIASQKPVLLCIEDLDALTLAFRATGNDQFRDAMDEVLVKVEYLAERNVIPPVVITSSRPWELGLSVLRRTERIVYLPLPDSLMRRRLLQRFLGTLGTHFSESDWTVLAAAAGNCSARELLRAVRKTVASAMDGKLIRETLRLELVNMRRHVDAYTISRFQEFVAKSQQ